MGEIRGSTEEQETLWPIERDEEVKRVWQEGGNKQKWIEKF